MKKTTLYNVLFPLWIILLFPFSWLIVLPGNFLIDTAVLFLGLYWLKIKEKIYFYKKNILKIFLFGLLSDIIGSTYLLIIMLVSSGPTMGDEPVLTLPALLISAVCIFVFNYFISLKTYEKDIRLKIALLFAVVTAPYTFLVPSSWLYS